MGRSYLQVTKETWMQTFILSFQSLGIIYGRLSTAPLYVFETIDAGDISSPEEIHELFSFIFWTLTLIPLLKYSFIVLKADDDGEGGPFSLYSLLCRHAKVGLIPSNSGSSKMLYHEEDEISSSPSQEKTENKARKAIEKYKSCHYLLLFLALLGACMILSDAVLRPAISVLSATSSLGRSLAEISKVFYSDKSKDHVTNAFKKYLPAPVACAILVGLFTLQHHGTKRIGCFFAPIIITWLLFISGFGLYNIIHYDAQILRAVSPVYMLRFLRKFNLRHGKLLSSTVLCIAGSEAMFADLGHFSKKSIKVTFICFVYPVLLLTYAGQAAFISKNLHADGAFHLSESIPNRDLEHIFAVLSLFASAVGSQATITAGFSIIHQCQALDCFPRVKVVHTSNKIFGQVYVADANWLFMVLSIAFTIGLHDTSKLARATGLSVTTCLLVTTCLMSLVIALYWEKHLFASVSFLLFFGSVEAIYLTSTLTSFFRGAWCLFILFVFFMTIMAAWHYGTLKKYESDVENKVSIEWLTDYSPRLGVSRVPGIGFVYSDVDTGIPAFFTHFISNIAAFHQVVVFVTFKASPVPYVHESRRYLIGRVGPTEYKMYRCIVRYGYHDNVRDTDDFEDDIIRSIGEFIMREEYDHEALNSPEGRMIVLGTPSNDGDGLITVADMSSSECSSTVGVGESQRVLLDAPSSSGNRKRVRFMLPPESPEMRVSVSQELGAMIDARESGTAYFLGQSHLMARQGSNLFKRLLVMTYVFLDKNCREPPVALNIPNAALLEVGTVYKI
ncbi:potassium transporter 6-like isoform X1 [Salvia splendens]|uniref:potassium transporter 6-like isoform X1 n=2 Tax=Salvia splendens TaxID=180675 RepID=UPI001C27F2F5|nr:potassium transporter 6-like isoform X1 [Salvia splendens]